MMQSQQPFVWGKGGQRVAPGQQAVDMSPVGSGTEGFARMAAALIGNIGQQPQNIGGQGAQVFPAAPQTMGNLFGLTNLIRGYHKGGGMY